MVGSATVYGFESNILSKQVCCGNAFAGAMLVWVKIGGRHGLGTMFDPGPLWKAVGIGVLADWEDWLVASTLDMAVVRAENFATVAGAWRRFFTEHGEDRVPTALRIAGALDLMAENGIQAVCFQHTNFAVNPWVGTEEEEFLYDLSQGKDHFFIGDYLKSRQGIA